MTGFDKETCEVETSTTVKTFTAIDMHKHGSKQVVEKVTKTFLETAFDNESERDVRASHLRGGKILPFAASHYDINPDLKNYVISPVCIMPSDLPNVNGVAFPFRVLSSFVPELGMLAYESWRYQPTQLDHLNEDITKAKGIVLDVGLSPIRGTGLWKVNALLAFDREKDPMLANDILTGTVDEYSMGAMVSGNTCSVCGAYAKNRLKPTCGHQPFGHRSGPYETFATDEGEVLAYWNVEGFKGFEVSALRQSPGAFRSAWTTLDRLIAW